jgi:hypothetical protein
VQEGGIAALFTPTGALLTTCSLAWIGLPFGGWELVFKRMIPGILLVALGFAVFNGLKSAYCSTLGANTYRCIASGK